MPTVLRLLSYRFFFYSNEGNEPRHIHVERDESVAKFWLEPVELAGSYGFRAKEINEIRRLVLDHQAFFINKWDEFFN